MGRNDAAETPQEMRWWARIEDECPITLEPISTMTTAPFFLDGSYFDADSLHGYLIDTGRLENPCTRAPLSRAVCRALDEHVGDGSRRVEALHAQESAGNSREAAVVTNALLDYYSRNRAASGGMRVVDDDEAPFVNAEADAAEEAFPSLVDRPPPPPRAVQNEGFADLARQRGEEEAVAAGRHPELIPDGEVWNNLVVEIEPRGTQAVEIWRWSQWDHLCQAHNPNKANYVEDISAHPHLMDINYCPPGGKAKCRGGGLKAGDHNATALAVFDSVGKTGERDWLHANSVDWTLGPDGRGYGLATLLPARGVCQEHIRPQKLPSPNSARIGP